MLLFDSHAHLDDEQFDADRTGVIRRAAEAGVRLIVAVGTTAASSRACVQLAAEHNTVFAAVGIQPNYCGQAGPEDWQTVVALLDEPRVVALGETGLDQYWDYTPLAVQVDYFQRHVHLAQDRDLPLVVHMRDSGEEILRVLRAARERGGPLRGVMHSFTGDLTLARACLELDLCLSFAGMVTYRKSEELRQVAAAVPADRILIETDAPYLSPHPARGRRPNEPALLLHTARCLAEVRGTTLEAFAAETTANARRLFGI